MKTIKSYTIVCPSCNGLGWIDNPALVSSSAQIVCPACNGSKTVIATETQNDEINSYGTYEDIIKEAAKSGVDKVIPN